MGLIEKVGFWRAVGWALNTRAGSALMVAGRGVANLSTRLLPGPRFDGPTPLVRLARPLTESTVSIVTTAGLHLEGDQPFDVDSPRGDPGFRSLPSNTGLDRIRVAHAHFSHRWWEEDPEVILPVSSLRALEAAGMFHLAPRFFSFGFAGTMTRELVDPRRGTAHQVARALVDDGVDLALLVPA